MSNKLLWFAGMACVAIGMFVTASNVYAATPTLSQTNITVALLQSTTITSGNGINVYLGSNSNQTVASVLTNNTQVTITGQSLGSSAISLCAVGTSDCTTINVTVQYASTAGISFSQNNLSLSAGSNQQVTVSGGSGNYTITNNSNSNAVSTALSGNTLTVFGTTVGNAALTTCDASNTNTCGTVSVTVTSSSISRVSFNQGSLSLITGGSQVMTLSGGNGAYHVSNNSNPNVVSANMSGINGVNIYTLGAGTATVTACDISNACAALVVTVTAPVVTQTAQAVTFNPATTTLTVGQTANVTLSGNASSFIILSETNANAVRASVANGITLSLYGVSAGTDSLTICAVGGGGCSALSVTVTGPASTVTTPTPTAVTTAPVTPTPVITPTIMPPVQSGTVVANTMLLSEVQALQAAITQILTQIMSIQTKLSQLESQVRAGSGSTISSNTSNANTVANAASGTSYNFTDLLTTGSTGAQVTALQQRLTTLGFFSGSLTGFFGPATKQAVIKYQTAHGIDATGYTGPSTRTALNAGN